MRQEILSTGIDIGTTTTQLIFSKIVIDNLANAYSVPRISIVSKEVIYRSDIYITPLINQNEIDTVKVKAIIEGEYQKAGYQPADLSTGAVIITGETARKHNANEVLNTLSEMAGDFVVATAGPDLEAVLAAKGAGTDRISMENTGVIANIDIGGGTSNIAVYQRGQLLATACLDVGGRLIKIQHNRISYVYDKIIHLAEKNGIMIKTGDLVEDWKLVKIAELLVEEIVQALNLAAIRRNNHFIYTNSGSPIPENIKVDGITFSGGVADCVYQNPAEAYQYNDIGVLLGRAIRSNPVLSRIRQFKAAETIRATVVGAGTHTTTVSGSTISYSAERLPIKNIPVLKISPADEVGERRFGEAIAGKIPIYREEGETGQIAVAFEGRNFSTYEDIRKLTRAIVSGARELIESNYPLIIVVEKDIAKVLGNELAIALDMKKEIICLDSIHADDGDYIDIGEPLVQGNVVPVIIKTLIFNS